MRSRVAEISEHSVAHVLGDIPVEAPDAIGDGAMVCSDDLAQILGVEPYRQGRRAHEVAEHYRELAPLGG